MEIFAKAFAVNPWFNAVVIADIENVEYIWKVTAVETIKHKHLGLRGERHRNGVVENSRSSVGAPIHRIEIVLPSYCHSPEVTTSA